MPYSPSKSTQDDILELTDIIEEGSPKSQEDEAAVDEESLDDELNAIFAHRSQREKYSNQALQDRENKTEDLEEDLDLDSFFEEIEKKSQVKHSTASEKTPRQQKEIADQKSSQLSEDINELKEQMEAFLSRLQSLEQSVGDVSDTMAHGLEKERHDPTHDHVIIERIQQELWHDIEEHLQKAIDQALLDQSLPALQEGLQGLRETTVKRQEIDQIRSELKAELSGYLHEIIPSIAAQVIRDEIAVLLKESP